MSWGAPPATDDSADLRDSLRWPAWAMVPTVKDVVVVVALVVAFATLVTTHVAIVARLVWRVRPRYRGLLAVVLPPLAPLWAYEQRWPVMWMLWLGAIVTYGVLLAVAAF